MIFNMYATERTVKLIFHSTIRLEWSIIIKFVFLKNVLVIQKFAINSQLCGRAVFAYFWMTTFCQVSSLKKRTLDSKHAFRRAQCYVVQENTENKVLHLKTHLYLNLRVLHPFAPVKNKCTKHVHNFHKRMTSLTCLN